MKANGRTSWVLGMSKDPRPKTLLAAAHFPPLAGFTLNTGVRPFRSVHNVPGPE